MHTHVSDVGTKEVALGVRECTAHSNELRFTCVGHGTKVAESSAAFVKTWLSHCPLPEKIVTDGGPEFVGHEWEHMLMNWGLKKGRISVHTPMANSVIESSHRTVGQILRAIFESSKPWN